LLSEYLGVGQAGGTLKETATPTGFHGFTVIKSILAARARGASRRRRYHFHVAVDAGLRRLLALPRDVMPELWDVLDYVANRTDGRVALTYYDVARDVLEPTAAAVGAEAAGAVDHAAFKQCAALRLMAPFMTGPLAGVGAALYVDMDSVVTCDLEALWEVTLPALEAASPGWVLAFSEEGAHPHYPTLYHTNPLPDNASARVKFPSAYGTGLNSGVFALRMDRWRGVAQEYWAHVVDIVRSRGYAAFNLSVSNEPEPLVYFDQVRGEGWEGEGWGGVGVGVTHVPIAQQQQSLRPSPPTSHPRARRTSSTCCRTAGRAGSPRCRWRTTGGSPAASRRSSTCCGRLRRARGTTRRRRASSTTRATARSGAHRPVCVWGAGGGVVIIQVPPARSYQRHHPFIPSLFSPNPRPPLTTAAVIRAGACPARVCTSTTATSG
jgi:hypothetical protein